MVRAQKLLSSSPFGVLIYVVSFMFLICIVIYNIAVHFRNRERITFDHLVSMKKPNEKCLLRVLRDAKEYEFSITLRPVRHVSLFCRFLKFDDISSLQISF